MNDVYKLTIVIVNWNTVDLLEQCLYSLFAGHGSGKAIFRVIVVDNASMDSSVYMVENRYPSVKLIKNEFNVGFAKANNFALSQINSEYVCLLNSDTVTSSRSFEDMLAFMDSHPNAVACAPALRLPDGELQTGGAGFALSLATALNYFWFLSKLFPFICKGLFIDQNAYVRRGKPARVDWLAGACLVVRKTAIDAVGTLDESFFMYAEDAEWCDRLRTVGDLYYLPALEIIHYHGASSKNTDSVSTKWLEATFKYFSLKHNQIQSEVFRLIVCIGFILRIIIYCFLCCKSNKWSRNLRAMTTYLIFVLKWKFVK